MSMFVVDIEADGPAPGLYSMVSFGAVKVDDSLATTFHGMVRPISEKWIPDALAVSKISREEHLSYPDPQIVISNFIAWVNEHNVGKPVFISDNNGFDWQFINYYCHAYAGFNPFGFSSRRIGDLYAGLNRDLLMTSQWKKLRTTKHTHNPVDDARGNAEALLSIAKHYHLKIPK